MSKQIKKEKMGPLMGFIEMGMRDIIAPLMTWCAQNLIYSQTRP